MQFSKASRFGGDAPPTGAVSSSPRKPTTPVKTPRKSRSALDLTPKETRVTSVSSNRSLKIADFFDPPSECNWLLEKEHLERKVKDLQQQKAEWDRYEYGMRKEIESLQNSIKRHEEKIRLLTIDNGTLSSKVTSLEARLREERKKETGLLSEATYQTQRVKELEKKLARLQLELEKTKEKENQTPKRMSVAKAMTPRGSESDREELTKLQKEKRLVDAKIRDIQEKHRLEKRQLQSQISALRAIPASEQRMMHEAFEAERTRLEADMKKMAKELDMWKTVAMGKDGEAKFLEENRRFSGISDQSDGFYDHDDESVCTLENVEMDIPSFHRAKASFKPTEQQTGYLSFTRDQLILIKKKSSDDTWVGEIAGRVGLVPADHMEDAVERDFEDATLQTLPPPTELTGQSALAAEEEPKTAGKAWTLPWQT